MPESWQLIALPRRVPFEVGSSATRPSRNVCHSHLISLPFVACTGTCIGSAAWRPGVAPRRAKAGRPSASRSWRAPPPPPNLEPKSWAAGWGPQRSGVRRVAGSVTCGPQGCLPDDAGEGMPPSPDVLWASSTPMMVWRRAWCSGDAADGSAHSHVVDRIGGAAAVAPGHAAWRLCSWTLLDCAAYSITTRLFDPQIHLVSQSSLRFQDSCHRFLGAPAATLCRGREIRLRSVR